MLFNKVNQLSNNTRSLAKQVGNVEIKQDSILRRSSESADNAAPLSTFTVVFAGEFNSGKSTLINALLGDEIQEAGVLPTTDAITIIMANNDSDAKSKHDDKDSSCSSSSSLIEGLDTGITNVHTQLHLLPTQKYPILSDLCLLDTPGTNAILSLQHTSSTLRILHDADLIVFVTSADRPFSESERQLLQTSIKSYRKRVVLVINKMDTLERQNGEDHGKETKKRVVNYVTEHAGDLLGASPVVIPLSARDALSCKLLYNKSPNEGTNNKEQSLWKRSNFAALEHFLSSSLTSSSKIRTKLLNPIGVSEGILTDCQKEIKRREEELNVDVMTLRLLTSQTDAWFKEIQTDCIDECDIIKAITNRSQVATRVIDELSWIDQWMIGLGAGKSIFDSAWDNANIRSQTVPQNKIGQNNILEQELLSIVDACVETLSTKVHNQGQTTIEYLGKRPAILGSSSSNGVNRMVGSVSTPKFSRLKELHPAMIAALQRSVSNIPNDSHYKDQLYTSLARTALISSVLMGGSFISGTLLAMEFIDMDLTTGLMGSSTLGVLGMSVLPLGNRNTSSSIEKEWIANAKQLQSTLDILLNNALEQIRSDLSESIKPYTMFVKSEGEWINELNEKLNSSVSSAHSLRSKINKACE